MRISNIFLIGGLLLSASCNYKSDAKFFDLSPKEGKGPLQTKNFNFDFDEIKVSQSIRADIKKADHEKVVIEAPADLMDDILVEQIGSTVHIHYKPGIRVTGSRVKATIFAKDFTKVEANSSAQIRILDKFTQDKTNVKVSSSGSVTADLEANELVIDGSSSGSYSGKIWAVDFDVDVSSSADVEVSGKAKNVDLDASSSGSVIAKNLHAENGVLNASSSGFVNVSLSNELRAKSSSSGSIEVIKIGNLNVVQETKSSSGTITVR